jgi:putative ABC transport system permease protein
MRAFVSFYLDTSKLALQAIWAHKLRAFLTLLGIIIGVASVVLVGAAISGLESYVLERISKLFGVNHFMIARIASVRKLSQEELQEMERRNKEIEWEDYEWLKRHCTSCTEVGMAAGTRINLRHNGRELFGIRVVGVTANMREIEDKEISEGRFIAPHEVERAAPVCVVGMDVVEKFFPDHDPLGETLKVLDTPLRIIGVEGKRGSFLGSSMDNYVYLPLTTFGRIFGWRRNLELHGKSASRQQLEATIEEARLVMRNRRKLVGNEQDNFTIVDVEQHNAQVDEFARTITLAATPITLVALLVGGIVVMNIMLVSVTERSFEIGLRKAVGARRRQILLQFLIESSLLSSSGGVLGLLLAAVISWVLKLTTTVPMMITFPYILLALLVSGSIGMLFGIYPAYRAARLDPVVALARL